MKTDILFYKLLEIEPALLLHLAHIEPPEGVQYQFQAIEVKDMAKRTDAVLLPNITAAPLIVAEVQYRRDETIYHRIINETTRLLLQMPEYKQVQMVVLFPYRTTDPGSGVWTGLVESGVLRVVIMEEEVEAQVAAAPTPVRAEEQAALRLIGLTVSENNEAADRKKLPHIVRTIAASADASTRKVLLQLLTNLYLSKYKHITIEELEAMLHLEEIFDDLHENVSVKRYGEEIATKTRLETQLQTKLESALAMLNAGILIEQVASILNLSVEAIEEARKKSA